MRRLLLAAAIGLYAPAAWAQTAPDPKAVAAAPIPAQDAAPDPAALAAARELAAISDLQSTTTRMMGPMMVDMRSGAALDRALRANPAIQSQVVLAAARNPAAWDAAMKKLGTLQADAMEQTMAGFRPEIESTMVDAYARTFTAREIREVIAFYRTPTGQKMHRQLPEITGEAMRKLMAQLMPQVAARQRALQPQIEAELAPLLKPTGQ